MGGGFCINKSIKGVQGFQKQYNKYDLLNDVGIGYTLKGEKFYFDKEDYVKIKDYCWHISSYGYLEARDENKQMLKMHKVIMPTNNKKLEVDHIDRNKTNNMKSNLRIVDRTYNNLNQGNRKDNKSGIKGVSFYKKIGRWVTQLKIKEKRYYKQFDTFEEACEYRKYLEETYINYNNLKEKQYGKVDNI